MTDWTVEVLPEALQQRIALILALDAIPFLEICHDPTGKLLAYVNAWEMWCSSSDAASSYIELLLEIKAIDLVVLECTYWDRFEYESRKISYKSIVSDAVMDFCTKSIKSTRMMLRYDYDVFINMRH